MWSVSARYLETIARPHTQVAMVEVLADGIVTTTIPGNQSTVDAVAGSVQVDRTSIRRSGSVDFLDLSGTGVPDETTDLFVPLIGEIRPYVGVIYHDATGEEVATGNDREFVPLATLVITSVKGSYPRLTVSGYDRLWYLSRFTAPYTIAAGTNIGTALTALLRATLPASHVDLDIPFTEHTTGLTVFDEQSEILDAVHSLGTAAGWAVYADPMGQIVARNEPTTEDPEVMNYAPGALSMLMRPERTVSAESTVNAWRVTGEAADLAAPVTGYAQDNDPNSLTYVGRVGVRANFQSSGLYRSNWQCEIGARTLLARNSGLSDTIAVPVVPNHALESGDVIHVTDPDQGIDVALLVDSFSLPLRATDGAQTLTCRSRVLR